jgi:hypothetical protein
MFFLKNPLFEDSITCGKYKKSETINSLKKTNTHTTLVWGWGVFGT